MKRMISLSGVLVVFSLIIITSQASAELKVTSDARMSSPQKNHTIRPAVRSLDNSDFYRDWRDWYDTIVEKPAIHGEKRQLSNKGFPG